MDTGLHSLTSLKRTLFRNTLPPAACTCSSSETQILAPRTSWSPHSGPLGGDGESRSVLGRSQGSFVSFFELLRVSFWSPIGIVFGKKIDKKMRLVSGEVTAGPREA